MGLIPKHADGYLAYGSPVCRLESIAEKLGMSEAEAQESVRTPVSLLACGAMWRL